MAIRERARLFCLFATGTVACAAQQDQRTKAMQWADHYAAVYQVPRELVHSIIEIESDWHPRAISNKGAVGLMQLMPATALTFGVTNRFEIEQNIRGGVAYGGTRPGASSLTARRTSPARVSGIGRRATCAT